MQLEQFERRPAPWLGGALLFDVAHGRGGEPDELANFGQRETGRFPEI